MRARWGALALTGAASLVPAASLLLAPQTFGAQLATMLSLALLVVAWTSPRFIVRLTGGFRPARQGLDVVLGWLNPAMDALDVGDLAAAQLQIDEAREHTTEETNRYVELWEALVDDERRRQAGERISRRARLAAIQGEYARLVLADEPIRPLVQGMAGIGVSVIVLASMLGI
jgi:hypothetical protein